MLCSKVYARQWGHKTTLNTRAPCPQRAYNMMRNIVIVIPTGEAMTYAQRI